MNTLTQACQTITGENVNYSKDIISQLLGGYFVLIFIGQV
jgi:hypothetical protein